MKPGIFHPDPSAEFYTPERCFILEVFNEGDAPSFSLARARVKPGVTTALHALKGTDEIYYILEGEGWMEAGGKENGHVKRGDVVSIPAGLSQRIANTGERDLLFLCICAPRFEPGVYEDLED